MINWLPKARYCLGLYQDVVVAEQAYNAIYTNQREEAQKQEQKAGDFLHSQTQKEKGKYFNMISNLTNIFENEIWQAVKKCTSTEVSTKNLNDVCYELISKSLPKYVMFWLFCPCWQLSIISFMTFFCGSNIKASLSWRFWTSVFHLSKNQCEGLIETR